MAQQLRQMIGGGLRPSDPRRFLIEAMVGAMTADGRIDDQELRVLRTRLEQHDLFAGLPDDAADMLIELGSDAVKFAGGGARRVGSIARGLTTRTHRLAAYAMACEVCAADTIEAAETEYLESLRRGLSIGRSEADDLLAAALEGKAMRVLDDKVSGIRRLLPLLVDCMVLYLLAQEQSPDDRGAWLRAVLDGIGDLSERPDELDREIQRSLKNADRRNPDPTTEVDVLAMDLDDPADRYWTVVYLFLVERSRGRGIWTGLPFYPHLQRAFALGDDDLHRAWQDATQLPRIDLPA
jgi:uncharacterized tellurite resistance protein B-like protein